MRFAKKITVISMFALLALLYVHQQVALVKMSYSICYKEKKLRDLLDRNERLGYNIDNLESPDRLEQFLVSRKIEIGFPKKGHVVNVASARNHLALNGERMTGVKKSFTAGFFDILSPRAEAQAKER